MFVPRTELKNGKEQTDTYIMVSNMVLNTCFETNLVPVQVIYQVWYRTLVIPVNTGWYVIGIEIPTFQSSKPMATREEEEDWI